MGSFIFFNIPAFGHVNVTLPIAKELMRRGNSVNYFNYEKFRERIVSQGLLFTSFEEMLSEYACTEDFEEIKDLKSQELFLPRAIKAMRILKEHGIDNATLLPTLSKKYEYSKSLELSLTVLDSIEFIEPIRRILQREKPDCVFVDSTMPGPRIAAESLGIPVVSSVITMVSEGEKQQYFTAKDDNMIKLEATLNKLLNDIRRKYGLNNEVTDEIFRISDEKSIVYSSPYFDSNGYEESENLIYIGTSFEDDIKLDKQYQYLNKIEEYLGPKVYISFGTVFSNPDFFYRVIRLFENSPIMVIMSIGQTELPSSLKLPSNFVIEKYLSQIEVLKRVDAVICHGGMSTTLESLYFGKPLLVFPHINDTPLWAARVEKSGAGIVGDIENLTDEFLINSVGKILEDDSLIYAAKKVGISLKSGGYKRASDILESFKVGNL